MTRHHSTCWHQFTWREQKRLPPSAERRSFPAWRSGPVSSGDRSQPGRNLENSHLAWQHRYMSLSLWHCLFPSHRWMYYKMKKISSIGHSLENSIVILCNWIWYMWMQVWIHPGTFSMWWCGTHRLITCSSSCWRTGSLWRIRRMRLWRRKFWPLVRLR